VYSSLKLKEKVDLALFCCVLLPDINLVIGNATGAGE
jgi:hypothetical protein